MPADRGRVNTPLVQGQIRRAGISVTGSLL